ncbi:DUF3573 domain-containing protein [Francisella sp. 19X1-34]|uniref:DUF3573 domain-containing protein n=1 Tax=Francisella sp. 19X1-34 TaxID=3087177 RepID=UPI002E33B4DA|nr:DUF3573 domain-containing protein [Francisella sp. 19X1-34]MED7788890.1 DUF3573 domain-containing protein [Francisella sp. 19X1-34]
MIQKFKKSLILASVLLSYGLGYSDNSQNVVSQGGPLGATSIGAQNLNNNSKSTNSASKNQNDEKVNEKELLLKLQKQVQVLQGQLKQIKSQAQTNQFKNTSGDSSQFATYSSKVGNNSDSEDIISSSGQDNFNQSLVNGQSASDIMENVNASNSIVNLGSKSLGGVFNQNGAIDVGGAPAITTQGQVTYLGSYSGNNSIPIGQISSNLFASTLLGQRDKFSDYSVFFGGFLEADAQAWFGSKNISPNIAHNGQNIYLKNAKLYFLSNLGHYVTAQFDFDTDESGAFSLGNAFVIFGNLDTSPFFVTAGRNKLSVGSYGGGGPLTGGITGAFLAPGTVTNVSLNYKNESWNANIAAFGAADNRADFSAGLFYTDSWTSNLIGAFNVGYVYNIAGADNSHIATALKNSGQQLDDVGAVNIDANLTYGLFGGFLQVSSGWATTTDAEEFNGVGNGNVMAGAWYVGSNYSLVLGGRNTNFNMTYGQSYNAAAIPMSIAASPVVGDDSPSGIQEQWIISAQRSYFDDNVLFGPEYAYQKLYNSKHMNTFTLDMSVYI